MENPPHDQSPGQEDVVLATLAEYPPPPASFSLFLDGTGRLRTLWRFAIFGIGFLAVQLVAAVPVTIYVFAKVAQDGGRPSPGRLQERLDAMAGDPVLLIIATILGTPLSLLLVFVCRRWLDRRSMASLGFVRPERRPTASITVGFLVGAAPILAAVGVVWLAGGFRLAGAGGAIGFTTLLLVPTLVLAAFFEEFVFRGYLLQNLVDVRLTAFGVAFTSIVFWLVHAGNRAAWSSWVIPLNLAGAGVILALAYLLSRNIWFPTALHFAWNFTQGIVLGIPVSGIQIDGFLRFEPTGDVPQLLTGGQFGLEASLATTLAELLTIAGLAAALMIRAAAPHEEDSPRRHGGHAEEGTEGNNDQQR